MSEIFDYVTTMRLRALLAEIDFHTSISDLAHAMGDEAGAQRHAEIAVKCAEARERIADAAIMRDIPSMSILSKGEHK